MSAPKSAPPRYDDVYCQGTLAMNSETGSTSRGASDYHIDVWLDDDPEFYCAQEVELDEFGQRRFSLGKIHRSRRRFQAIAYCLRALADDCETIYDEGL